jgi:hypothetical protein
MMARVRLRWHVGKGSVRVETSEVGRWKREVEDRYGPWTQHNIQLRDDLYTIRPGLVGGIEMRLQQIVQVVPDVAQAPIDQLRVLDLGALEGLFALEFARRGATVVAIEGREANLEMIRFAKEVLGLDRWNFGSRTFEGSTGGSTGSSTSFSASAFYTTWTHLTCSTSWSRCWTSAVM